MPSTQTRTIFQQDQTIGGWLYRFKFARVQYPYPLGAVPETVVSTTTIPDYISIECGGTKKSFDLTDLGKGDMAGNVPLKLLDDAAGSYWKTNLFTVYDKDTVYQFQLLCDKGTGTLQDIFFGEIDTRTLEVEPEYFSVALGLRKQMIACTATSVLEAGLGKMGFGDTNVISIGTGRDLTGHYDWGSHSWIYAKTPVSTITGVMNGFASYKTATSILNGSIGAGAWNPPNVATDMVFASWQDIITQIAQAIANRCGYTTGAVDTANAFSHLAMSYGGSKTAVGTTVTSLASQLAFHRTGLLATSVNILYSEKDTVSVYGSKGMGPVPVQDYSLAKQGTAWDGLETLLTAFMQYAVISLNDATSTVTVSVRTPLGTLAAFVATEPKTKNLKYRPLGFAIKSVSARLSHPDNGNVESLTLDYAANTSIPTNNITLATPFTNASEDTSVLLFTGQYFTHELSNHLAVFHNGPDYTTVELVDGNANGAMQSAGLMLYPVTVNQGFGNALGTTTALTLTDAVSKGLYSLFCGQDIGSGSQGATSSRMEIVECEFPVSQYADDTAGGFVDTRGVTDCLLKTIVLTTDASHTFIITSCEVEWVGVIRTAKIVAVRTVA